MLAEPRILEVEAAAEGERLDRFIAHLAGSRSQAEALIEAGLVLVDGERRPKRHLVRRGQRIQIAGPAPGPSQPPAPRVEFAIVHEDAHLLVVDKPAGLVVHPARGHRSGTLAQALAGRAAGGEDPWRAGIVHRLDRDTSGLLVVAKSDSVHRALKALLAERKLRRGYLALVEGRPQARSGTIEAPIGRHRRDRTLMSIDSAEPREARTHFELERAFADCSLLRVSLDTGRTHQIRVHMQAIGHPLVGDRQYGGKLRYGLARQFLHAAQLAFRHPVTGSEMELCAALPEDLQAALQRAAAEPERR